MITAFIAFAAVTAAPASQPSKEFIQACYDRAKSQAELTFCSAGEAEGKKHDMQDADAVVCFDQAMTQMAMDGCADAAARRADARLNAQWAKTAAAFKHLDQDNKGTPWPTKAFDSLLKGQRAWLAYREATCRAQGLVNAGGSIAPMNELLCRVAITDVRTKELFDLSRNPNNPDESL